MTKEKIYILQKDLPNVKAGTEFHYMDRLNKYMFYRNERVVSVFDCPPEIIESCPEWFKQLEEVEEEQPFQWTDKLVEELVWDNFGAADTRFRVEQFKKDKQQSQTIPVGKGTANDVGNEKDWEILQCENKSLGIHDFVAEGTSSTPCLKPNKPCKIHSVKRLSDMEEIFTVGDEVEYRGAGAKDWSDVCGFGKIRLFKVVQNGHKMVVEIDDNNEWDDNHFPHKYLENIRHKKPQPEIKERIEVEGFFESGGTLSNVSGKTYREYKFHTHYPIQKEKYSEIKQSIEKIINNDSYVDITETIKTLLVTIKSESGLSQKSMAIIEGAQKKILELIQRL